MGWRRQGWDDDDENPVNLLLSLIWRSVAQPLLFGLIGAEIRAAELEGETVGIGIGCLAVSLTFRVFASVLAVLGSGMNLKEKLFIPLAWLPKATVQAAIGATAYDQAKERLGGKDCLLSAASNAVWNTTMTTTSSSSNDPTVECLNLGRGLQVLTLAVLAILITAPIGAVAIALSAPRLLEKAPPKKEENDVVDSKKNDDSNVDEVEREEGV